MREFVVLNQALASESRDSDARPAQPVVTVKESERRIELSYRFPGFYRHGVEREVQGKRARFDIIGIEGAGETMEGGKPALPSFGRYVQIPDACDFKVKVVTGKDTVTFENVKVIPAQEHMTDGPSESRNIDYDAVFYDQDEWFPREPVTVSGPFLIDGYSALLVHVAPLQYNPNRRRLLGHPAIDVTLELAPKSQARGDDADEPETREAFGNLFLNPRRGQGARVGLPLGPLKPSFRVGPEFLIIHAPAFQAAAQRLADWKNRRGLITERMAYPGTLPLANAETLKAELRRRRGLLGSRLRYVCLLGDVDDIPAMESALGNTTDFYYSTRNDPVPGGPIQLPWLSLGRIPVRNAQEATDIVDQIIGYERNPPSDPAYYHRFVCAALFQSYQNHETRGYLQTMERIRTFLTALGYDAERVYTFDTDTVNPNPPLTYLDGTSVPAEVLGAAMTPADATQRLVEATTEGHLLIAHRDHGDWDGWHMPPFKLGDLEHVTGDMPSIFYSLNCLTGTWDATTTNECFAEKVLRMDGTAPTLIASTELSNTLLNNAMMLGLFDAMYGGLLPTFPGTTASYPIRFNRLGDILNYSRSYLPLVSSNAQSVVGHFEMYHVMGDPSLEVWSDAPRPLRVQAKVTVRGLEVVLSSVPADCVVTLWMNGKVLKRVVPTRPRFVIPAPETPLGPLPGPIAKKRLSVCAWAPGHHYAETQVVLPTVIHKVVAEPVLV